MDQKITIRPMATEKELQIVMEELGGKEGWNPGKYDYKSYFAMDPRGFFVLLVDDKVVGSLLTTNYSEGFGFIGHFIVAPEYRSKGLGKKLWEAALKHLAACRTVGLHSVPQQISRYQASGFNSSYENSRWASKTSDKAEDVTHLINASAINSYPNAIFKKSFCEYDMALFKYNREKLFDTMLSMPQTIAFVSSNKEGKINGYGVVRPCEKGFRVGPLYADDFESAKSLCRVLLSKIPGEPIIFDIPKPNTFGAMFAEYFNLTLIPAAATTAMIKGEEPKEMIENTSRCYGIASFELGLF